MDFLLSTSFFIFHFSSCLLCYVITRLQRVILILEALYLFLLHSVSCIPYSSRSPVAVCISILHITLYEVSPSDFSEKRRLANSYGATSSIFAAYTQLTQLTDQSRLASIIDPTSSTPLPL